MAKNIDYTRLERNARIRTTAVRTTTYVMLTLWALLVLFPFYWMILTSFKSYSSYNAEYYPQFITLSPTLQNYIDAGKSMEFWPTMAKSAIIAPLPRCPWGSILPIR